MKEAYKQKQIIIDEIKDKFERAESAVVIDYMGITVAEADEMRKKLREAEVDYTVYKNTLVKRAIEGTKYEALGEILEGPSGFAFSYDDATAPARVLNDARKAYKKMEFKGGIIEGGEMICYRKEPTNARDGVEAILSSLYKVIDALIDKADEDSAIGISSTGDINPISGEVIYATDSMPSFAGLNLAEIVSRHTGRRATVINDCIAALIGEWKYGAAAGCQNVIMLTLGTGGGGAVISDGRMVAGANGAAGEFGHMTINPAETETCACGRRGCVQQYVSASDIARLARKYLAEHEGESALRSVEKLTTKDVFDAAKNGDSAANAILENVYDAFGYAISAVCTVADPEVVVVGGGVSKAGEVLVEGAKKGFLKYVFYPNTDVRFNLAVLGNDAGIYGCCKLLLDSLA